MNYQQAICVGGPFAGRLVAIDAKARGMDFAEWPKPEYFLRESIMRVRHDDMQLRTHSYRWERASLVWGFAAFDAIAIVHESIKSREEINRVVCAMAFSQMMVLTGETTPTAKGIA